MKMLSTSKYDVNNIDSALSRDGHHSTRLHINPPRMQTGSTEEKR